jgi:hypothetical protein
MLFNVTFNNISVISWRRLRLWYAWLRWLLNNKFYQSCIQMAVIRLHDITEILLKVTLNNINHYHNNLRRWCRCSWATARTWFARLDLHYEKLTSLPPTSVLAEWFHKRSTPFWATKNQIGLFAYVHLRNMFLLSIASSTNDFVQGSLVSFS